MVNARSRARRLTFDDVDLHVFYLDPHQQEINFPHNYILQMVPKGGGKDAYSDTVWTILHSITIHPGEKKLMAEVYCSPAAAPLLGFVVLKLNVEAVLNPNLHFNGGVELRVGAQRVHHNVHLFSDVV